jgi:hypothetical protein
MPFGPPLLHVHFNAFICYKEKIYFVNFPKQKAIVITPTCEKTFNKLHQVKHYKPNACKNKKNKNKKYRRAIIIVTWSTRNFDLR